MLSFTVCRAQEQIVAGAEPGCRLARRAVERLQKIRERLEFIDRHFLSLVADSVDRVTVWLFAGGLVSASVARALSEEGIETVSWDNVSLTVRTSDVQTVNGALSRINPETARPALPSDLVNALKFSPKAAIVKLLRHFRVVPNSGSRTPPNQGTAPINSARWLLTSEQAR
jgi:hypothetical protein